jgi:hypothetical protein
MIPLHESHKLRCESMHADRVELVESARYFRRPLRQNTCAIGLKDRHGECDLGTTNNAFAQGLSKANKPAQQAAAGKQTDMKGR